MTGLILNKILVFLLIKILPQVDLKSNLKKFSDKYPANFFSAMRNALKSHKFKLIQNSSDKCTETVYNPLVFRSFLITKTNKINVMVTEFDYFMLLSWNEFKNYVTNSCLNFSIVNYQTSL